MGKRITDMIGRRFGRWTVIAETDVRRSGSVCYLCRCECGNERIVRGALLIRGDSQSCGCYNRDLISKFGKAVYKEKLYGILNSIKQRCGNPDDSSYKNYGGRGIHVCSEWRNSYDSFKKWAYENGYKKGLWIDRIDNNGNYCPENCRWVTPKTQQRNKRTNVIVVYEGQEMCLTEAAEKSGVKACTLKRRMELGWADEDLFKPIQKKYSHGEMISKALKGKERRG